MIIVTTYIVVLLTCFVLDAQAGYPEVPKTQGHICTASDKDFKEFRYRWKMPYCKRNVSQSLKRYIYHKYGISYDLRYNYTIDHIIPLSIGGSNHPDNLWPEHLYLKCKRGNLEFDTYLGVSRGELTPESGRKAILNSKLRRK